MYQLNFFKLFEHELIAIFGSPIFIPRILVLLSVFGEGANEARRCRRRRGMKLSAIGEGAQ